MLDDSPKEFLSLQSTHHVKINSPQSLTHMAIFVLIAVDELWKSIKVVAIVAVVAVVKFELG